MTAGLVSAALFNSKREKRTDRVWKWVDFHPAHQTQTQQISGTQLMAQALAMAGDCEWEFAPGMTLDRIIVGDINGSQGG